MRHCILIVTDNIAVASNRPIIQVLKSMDLHVCAGVYACGKSTNAYKYRAMWEYWNWLYGLLL